MPVSAQAPVADPHTRLRLATRAGHGRVDAHFPQGFPDGAAYRTYLRGMHRFVADTAAALRIEGDFGGTSLMARCAAAQAALAADLADAGAAPLPPAAMPPTIGGESRQLGWDYVFTGSAMGARMLLSAAARLGHDARHGARFLAQHAATTAWTGVLAAIAATDGHGPGCTNELHAGAGDAFAFADTCFTSARDLEECLAR